MLQELRARACLKAYDFVFSRPKLRQIAYDFSVRRANSFYHRALGHPTGKVIDLPAERPRPRPAEQARLLKKSGAWFNRASWLAPDSSHQRDHSYAAVSVLTDAARIAPKTKDREEIIRRKHALERAFNLSPGR